MRRVTEQELVQAARLQDKLNPDVYEYDGEIYPAYLKTGNAMQHIAATALHFCKGAGLDVGCGAWPLPGAHGVDLAKGDDAMDLRASNLDFIFSSHALEHIADAVGALIHWKDCLRPGGVLFLYLPSTQMRYWNTTRNRKHRHEWEPEQMARILRDLGFVDVMHGERDLCWSFATVGWKP